MTRYTPVPTRLMSIDGSGLVPLLTEFAPWLMEQALAIELTTNLAEPEAWGTARLTTGDAHVAIRRVGQRIVDGSDNVR